MFGVWRCKHIQQTLSQENLHLKKVCFVIVLIYWRTTQKKCIQIPSRYKICCTALSNTHHEREITAEGDQEEERETQKKRCSKINSSSHLALTLVEWIHMYSLMSVLLSIIVKFNKQKSASELTWQLLIDYIRGTAARLIYINTYNKWRHNPLETPSCEKHIFSHLNMSVWWF